MWKQLRERKKQCSWNCGRGNVAEAVTRKDAGCKLEHWSSLLGRVLLFGFRLGPSVSGLQERSKGRAAIQSSLIYNELISELQTNREDQEARNLLNKTWSFRLNQGTVVKRWKIDIQPSAFSVAGCSSRCPGQKDGGRVHGLWGESWLLRLDKPGKVDRNQQTQRGWVSFIAWSFPSLGSHICFPLVSDSQHVYLIQIDFHWIKAECKMDHKSLQTSGHPSSLIATTTWRYEKRPASRLKIWTSHVSGCPFFTSLGWWIPGRSANAHVRNF